MRDMYIFYCIVHAFESSVTNPKGELFCTEKFMTTMRKNSYWYHEPDEAIPVMMKLK